MSYRFNQGDRPLAGYTIQRGVGRGGFGEVYYSTSDGGKDVALKYLRENPQIELRGVMHCLNLKSPYLVGIHDIKQSADGEFFVIMEYVNGPSLRDLMNNEPGGLGVQKAAYFLREVGKGLAYLHDRGIVHRDLKPGNIFYEDGYVKIGDYGLAKIMAASQHSGQTMSVGTVHYMAPEVGSGNYDRTIDIYALGVMLYEMLLGKVPFSGSSMGEVLMKHLTAQPAVDELPAPFPNVIRKALAKDPNDRYQTVTEMMADVFSVKDVSHGVDSIDSLSLTRMAAAVAQKVRTEPVAHRGGGGIATGSSSMTAFAHTPGPPPPPRPPVIERSGGVANVGRDLWDQAWKPATKWPAGVAPFPQRYRLTTGLLGLFLGPFGIHRFYTGYNAIGVFQILASFFTGIGVLWGLIDGILILFTGNFLDAAGRPLLESEWKTRPGGRPAMGRFFWGVLALGFTAGSIATFSAGVFADPDMSQCGVDIDGQSYYWNTTKAFFFVTSGLFAAACFALWKASHRGGLTFWRSSIRPGLMCFMMAVGLASFNAYRNLAAGELQLVFLGVSAAACLGFTKLWILRGPAMQVLPGDAYWNRMWGKTFMYVWIACAIVTSSVFTKWAKAKFALETGEQKFRTFAIQTRDHSRDYQEMSDSTVDSDFEEPRSRVFAEGRDPGKPKLVSQKYRVAGQQYSSWPLATLFTGLMAFGAANESSYRKKMALRAFQELKDKGD